jgi:hypothetical protein
MVNDNKIFFIGVSLRKVEPQQQNQRNQNQGDLMREIREGECSIIMLYLL